MFGSNAMSPNSPTHWKQNKTTNLWVSTVEGKIMGSPIYSCPTSQYIWICKVIWQWRVKVADELRLLISWPWNGEMILDYPAELNMITRVLIRGRGRQKRKNQRVSIVMNIQCCWLCRCRNGAVNQAMWAAS